MVIKTSCVIPTYNRCPYNIKKKKYNPLWWCLTSLNMQSKRSGLEEIIIVDDNSQDFTKKIVKELSKVSKIKILYKKNNKRLGSGKSRNEGVKIAKNNLIFFLDDDCILLKKDILEKANYVFEVLKTKKIKIGALALPVTSGKLGSDIVNSNYIGTINKEQGKMMRYHTEFPAEYLTNQKKYYLNKKEKIFWPLKVSVAGGVFLCDRKAFRDVEGFSIFPWKKTFGEEPEFMLNIQKKGWEVFYLPSLDKKFRVFHCKFGYRHFNRDVEDDSFKIWDIYFKKILKESSKPRKDTGNRIDKEELFYSMIISDLWIMFKHFGDKVGLTYVHSKYKEIKNFSNNKIYKDLNNIKVNRKIEIFKRAVSEGVELLKQRDFITKRTISILTQKYDLSS